MTYNAVWPIHKTVETHKKQENVCVKHYAPNHMLASKRTHIKSEKEHNSIMYGIYSKFKSVLYTLDTNFVI